VVRVLASLLRQQLLRRLSATPGSSAAAGQATPAAEAATDDVAEAASGAFAQRLHRRAIGGRVYLERGGRV